MIIKDFSKKKLVEYLKDDMRVMIFFDWHGMGDCVMFLPLYKKLKELFPKVSFNLMCNVGQEVFNEMVDKEHDIYFSITFPEFDSRMFGTSLVGMSKPEICAEYELGIPFDETMEFTWKPEHILKSGIPVPENAIGVAFQVTSNPNKSISEDSAEKIWSMIKEHGYTPIEVHFEHILGNKKNNKYPFVDLTCREYKASIENVIDVISRCKGFIGVNTGTFCMATSMMDGRTLHMYKRHHFAPNYKRFNPVMEVDCREPYLINENIVSRYLGSCNK